VAPTSFEESAQARRQAGDRRPIALMREQMRAERQPAARAGASRPARRALSRPPCVTASQLLRATLLILAGLVYANHPQLFHAGAAAARIAARAGVDAAPTGTIGR